jgi:DNA-binding MarR family transcriptional regulator
MSDLAAQTALTPSGLTRAVDRLCDAGLVSRQVCPEDRRGAFAALTEEGTSRMADAMSHHLRQVTEVLGSVLDESEFAELEGLLRRLRDRVNPSAAKVTID